MPSPVVNARATYGIRNDRRVVRANERPFQLTAAIDKNPSFSIGGANRIANHRQVVGCVSEIDPERNRKAVACTENQICCGWYKNKIANAGSGNCVDLNCL